MQAEQEIFILDAAYTDEPGIAALPETGTADVMLVTALIAVAAAALTYALMRVLQSHATYRR